MAGGRPVNQNLTFKSLGGRVGTKNPTQKTRKKPTAKNPRYLGFLGFMGFLKKETDFRVNIKMKINRSKM